MNLVDTNGVVHIFDQNLTLGEDCYLAPDVSEEVEMTKMIYSKETPETILNLSDHSVFNQATYLGYYKRMLNKYGGRSFFNMTGFGDVSILASIHTLIFEFKKQKEQCLFDFSEDISVFTKDEGLKKRINLEFEGKSVEVLPITDINKL